MYIMYIRLYKVYNVYIYIYNVYVYLQENENNTSVVRNIVVQNKGRVIQMSIQNSIKLLIKNCYHANM